MAIQLPDQLGECDDAFCLECGKPVTKDFRRVFGDEDDRAHRCRECDTFARLKDGSAAGLDVNNADPLTDPQMAHHVTSPIARADGGEPQ